MNIKYTNEIPTNKKKLVTNNPVVNTVAKQLEISKAKPDKFLKSIFNEVFNRKTWGSSGDGSGPGSTLQYTFKTRNIIKEVIQKYEIKSMLDAPCGAMAWMPELLKNLTATNNEFKYHGIDLVDEVINKSIQKYSNEFQNWKFSVFDFTQRPLPEGNDLIFSRDALQHLSLNTIVNALQSFATAKTSRYLLVGSYLNNNKNSNIRDGDYFLINLTLPPFSLDTYVDKFREETESGNGQKFLILYDIQKYLSKINFDKMRENASKF